MPKLRVAKAQRAGRAAQPRLARARATRPAHRRAGAETQVGLLAFPGLTQLDLTGPLEVLARLPGVVTRVIAHSSAPVPTDRGFLVTPSGDLRSCPQLDVIVVPGGPGQQQLMEDETVLSFLQTQAEGTRYVASVCTGALVLGAAGLLRGYRATTHWLSLPLLAHFGAQPVAERVVIDRDRVTGAGVTAGIDFGLTLAALLCGPEVAQRIQLQLQYDPQPPFTCGSPASAPRGIVAAVKRASAQLQEEREQLCARLGRRRES